MVNTLNGLEKAVAEMKLQSQKTADQIGALSYQLDDFIWEFRASLALQLRTFPKFDGSEVLVWLARANQYFLLNKTPSDRRVDFAMLAIDGPAKPWKQLLVRRCPSLSWERFVQELLKRFGETSPTPKPQPQPLPLHSGPPPQPRPQPQPVRSRPTPKPQPQPLSLHSSPPPQPPSQPQPLHSSPPPQPQPQPQFATTPTLLSAPMPLPLPLQRFVSAAAAEHTKFVVLNPPTTAKMSSPKLSASPENLQFQSPFSSLLWCLFSSAGTPFYYMSMLRCLHIVDHLLWFNALATTRKHEFEPPPDKVIGFSFHLRLEGKAVSRVRQLIRIVVWPTNLVEGKSQQPTEEEIWKEGLTE